MELFFLAILFLLNPSFDIYLSYVHTLSQMLKMFSVYFLFHAVHLSS